MVSLVLSPLQFWLAAACVRADTFRPERGSAADSVLPQS
jgi:hypothetical protein